MPFARRTSTRTLQPRHPDAQLLAKVLLDRGWLTAYQVNHLLQGRGGELRLGPYTILERLGEGGMGQVFKARHHQLGRTVALKVIRQDYAADAEAVGRFYREMQATGKLTHPNVVRASDSGPVGSTHMLIMEYVPGIDLDRLVRQSGPLPVSEACEYVRQAALGLQHIHEHGLVHRDIKPSNLMLTKAQGSQSLGFVKLLDLGLARLQESVHGKTSTRLPDGETVTTLTLDGSVTLGTVDYLSPEQALDFHQVDIRGDIYSLGCTLFYLLTGHPPFGDGSLTVKLMRHQQAEPPDLKKSRPDVPEALLPIFHRMLAKRPEDRYQIPGEAAQALANLAKGVAAEPVMPATKRRRWPIAILALLLAGTGLDLVMSIGGLSSHKASSSSEGRSELNSLPSAPLHKSTQPVSTGSLPAPSDFPVSVSSVSTGKRYDVVSAKVGGTVYIDRDYTIVALSPALDGGALIRAANNDKQVATAEHLKLLLKAPADVFIGYDGRATSVPAWLSDGSWQRTSETLRSKDGSGELSRIVYRKRFGPGLLILGGPQQQPAKGNGTHYVVIVK
jgi:serine/threonine protein kinase